MVVLPAIQYLEAARDEDEEHAGSAAEEEEDEEEEDEEEESEREEEGAEEEAGEQRGAEAISHSHPASPSLTSPALPSFSSLPIAHSPPLSPPSLAAPLVDEGVVSSSDDESSVQGEDTVKAKVATEMGKTRARQHRKYHSKKGAGQIGRAKGSKAKHSDAVKIDSGGWF
jgi:RIO kinase 2